MRRAWRGVVGAVLVAGAAAAGQVEVALPATVTVETGTPVRLELGVHAVEPVRGLALGGTTLAAALPTEGTLLLPAGGPALLAYHDRFLGHWRGRTQEANLGGSYEDLLHPPAGWTPPKVVRDLDSAQGDLLAMPVGGDLLCWSGTLTWRFEPGLPIRGLAFTDTTGRRHTGVGYCDDAAYGTDIVVSVSADGSTWTEVWRGSWAPDPEKEEEEPVLEVTGGLPAALDGATTLYVRFQGNLAALLDLYVTLSLDASAVAPALQLPAGATDLELAAASGTGPVIVFWPGTDVTPVAPPPPAPPAAPEVTVTSGRVTVRFPSGAEVALCRGASGGVTGPCRIAQDGVALLDAPAGWDPAGALVMLDGPPVEGYTDWAAEVAAFDAAGGVWRSTGSRPRRDLPLGSGTLVATEARPDGTVAVRCALADGEASGTLTWELRPVTRVVGGRAWHGAAWRVVLEGLDGAELLRTVEPAALHAGWWWIEQGFRGLTDDPIDFASPYDLPVARATGSSLGFRFAAGEDGSELGRFRELTWARVETREELGRRMIEMRVPLGAGHVRATPWREWMAGGPVADGWAARDLWAEVRDGITGELARRYGLPMSRPRPTLVWNQPDPQYYETWVNTGQPPDGKWWFDTFREVTLPAAAAAGLRTVYIQPPWENDAEHGVRAWSAHAPRGFVVSPALGGEARLRAAIERAHELGIQVVLWYPSSFSLDAPMFAAHPDRVPFTRDGTPENGGWPDVVGVDLASGYLAETIRRLRELHASLGFDGLWLDSWDGLTLLADYRRTQPEPQLAQAVQLLGAMWGLGIREVITEGIGPLAAADAYGDYESHSGPPRVFPRVRRELEALRGREYLLYRIGADTLLDGEIYFRALAAGGMLKVANLDEVTALEGEDATLFAAANRAFAALEDLMEHRHLEVRDGNWVGVRWRAEGSADEALYAFAAFDVPLPPGASVRDVTTDETVSASGTLAARAWHAYRIRVRGARPAGGRTRGVAPPRGVPRR